MFEQSAGLALLAAVSPSVMLIAALYLASARPAKTTAFFVLGGLLAVTVVGIAALVAMRAGGLSLNSQRTPRYGLRLGLGVIALAAAAVILRRKPRPANPGDPKKRGLIARWTADPRPTSAFAVGAMMFAISGAFLAAVQVVATSKATLAATTAAMTMIIALTLTFAWLPLTAYLIAPERTTATLAASNAWIAGHSRVLLASAVGVIGVALIAQGAAGLT